MLSDDLAKKVGRYVNRNDPLGPSDAARITDDEVAARLFDPHNHSFNTLLRSDLSIVTGRRGSGKTALLRSYKYRRYLEDTSPLVSPYEFDLHNYEYVTELTSYKQFEEMQKRVAGAGDILRPIESVQEDWSNMLRRFILVELVARTEHDSNNEKIVLVRRYLQQNNRAIEEEIKQIMGETFASKIRGIFNWKRKSNGQVAEVPVDMTTAWNAATDYLEKRKRRLLVIFDSMGEYDVKNRTFNRTVGALMRFMSSFNAENDNVKIKLGLPVEVFPDVQRASANPLKDMVNFDQVRWTSTELARIAAFRYRLFLNLYDKAHARMTEKYNLSKRRDVWDFWHEAFPEKILNRYGREEKPFTYVIRHTQLLPRQLFMILQSIAKESAKGTGGYRRFSTNAIINSIENMEPVIAEEILGAFRYVYPFAGRLSRAVFGNFPTVFTYDELEDRWRKKGRAIMAEQDMNTIMTEKGMKFAMVDFGEMLVRMCIVGLAVKESTQYIEARFAYHQETPFNIGEGQQLCLHPVFSKHFSAAPNQLGMAVLPIGSEPDIS